MSRVETHKGKLTPLDLAGDTLEDRARELCLQECIEMDKYENTWLETVMYGDACRNRFFVHEKREVIFRKDDTEVDPDGFIECTVNDDGTYDYFISWYNGGAGMDEVLESAMKYADRDKNGKED